MSRNIAPYAGLGCVAHMTVSLASLGFVREMCTIQSEAAKLFECNNIIKLVLVCFEIWREQK
jgi:hypothetical protein